MARARPLPKLQRELVQLALSQIDEDNISGFTSTVSLLAAAGLLDYPKVFPCDNFLLHRALSLHRTKHARRLLKAGAGIETRDFRSVTPLMKAAEFSPPLTREILAAGGDVKAVDTFQCMALHHAAGSVVAPVSILTQLIKANSDIHALDTSARTPLHYAAAIYDTRKIKVLLKHGARKDLAATGSLGTPLEYMLSSGSKAVAADPSCRLACAALLAT